MLLHVWKGIYQLFLLTLSYFGYIFLLLTEEFFHRTVFYSKVISLTDT